MEEKSLVFEDVKLDYPKVEKLNEAQRQKPSSEAQRKKSGSGSGARKSVDDASESSEKAWSKGATKMVEHKDGVWIGSSDTASTSTVGTGGSLGNNKNKNKNKNNNRLKDKFGKSHKTSTRDLLDNVGNMVQRFQGEKDALQEKLRETEEKLNKQIEFTFVQRKEDKQPDWIACRQHIRLRFNKFMGHPKRLEYIYGNAEMLVQKYNLRMDPNYAAILDAMIYDEAGKLPENWDATKQWHHDDNHTGIFDWYHQRDKFLRKVAKYSLVGASGLLAVGGSLYAIPSAVVGGVGIAVLGAIARRNFSDSLRITKMDEWMDVCVDGTPLNEIDEDCWYDAENMDGVCKPRRYLVGFTIAFNNIIMYRGCCHNELVALVNRQLVKIECTENVRRETWAKVEQLYFDTDFVKALPDFSDPSSEEMEEFIQRYPVARRNMVNRQVPYVDGLGNTDVSGFVKTDEIMMVKSEEKAYPRFITNYPITYLLNTVPFWTWQKKCYPYVHDITKRIFFSSGVDANVCGEWLSFYVMLGYKAYELDEPTMDAHVCIDGKSMLHRLYQRKNMPRSVLLHFLATSSLKGRTSHNIKFSTVGKVGSGHIDTSLGDSHLTAAKITFCMKMLDVEDWAAMINGDDNVLMVLEDIDSKLDAFIHYYHLMGSGLEIIPRPNINFLEYCSARFWRIGEHRYVLGPKIGRVLAKSFMPHRPMSRKKRREHIVSVAKGYYHYRWLPGIDVLLSKLGVTSFSNHHKLEFKSTLSEPIEVDMTYVEEMFEDVYGTSGDSIRKIISEIDFSQINQDHGLTVSHPLLDLLATADNIIKPEVELRDHMNTDGLFSHTGSSVELPVVEEHRW